MKRFTLLRSGGLVVGCALLASGVGEVAAGVDPLFPFVISFDAPENVTNVSGWLAKPAGRDGVLRAEGGHLVNRAGPVRLWATNLCFDACFPTHEQSERVAARLARLGINCVRMHHMDNHSIWGKSPNKLTIDPERLERLDYLIHQLKEHGVYTDLNLHVSRWFDESEGFSARQERPNYDKGLDNFEPRMIDLQKKYARDLLTHVNPYTKTAYTDEPAVAMVEINNENALWATWSWGQLDDLPEPYATTFRKLWNAWLRKKYGTTAELAAAWNSGEVPLGAEMLRGGDFAGAWQSAWNLERDGRTQVTWLATPGGPEGKPCLRVVVTRQGEVSWRPQLSQGGLQVKANHPYTLRFALRGEGPREIQVNCMMAHEPWRQLGLSTGVKLATTWTRQELVFLPTADDANARITLTGLVPGTYELSEVSLRPGGVTGLGQGQRLEDDSVPVLRHGRLNTTEPARHDFADFLWDTERDYWQGMYRYLKDELGVKMPVSGTQLSYSPPSIQAELDYVDAHAYWHHPNFPGRPWDSKNWTVKNAALVNSPGGTLADLAVRRVWGKAFTVSEYNHPAPNEYAAEAFPMIAAFGAFQGWDGVFSFSYNHNVNFEPRRIEGFFDIKGDPAKIAHMPACAAMFLRGDVAPAKQTLRAGLPPEAQRQKLRESLTPWNLTAEHFGLDPRLALSHGVAVDLAPQPGSADTLGATAGLPSSAENTVGQANRGTRQYGPAAPPSIAPDAKVFVSDTGQIRWDVSEGGAGTFTVDTPRNKLASGFVRGRTFSLGEIRLTIGPTRLDWATVSMVAIDSEGFDRPGRILLVLTGVVQNQDATLTRLEDDLITLGDRWGGEPVLCEGVPAKIELPVPADRVEFFPLDPRGARREPIAVESRQGKAVLAPAPRHQTIWYEAVIR